MIDTKNILTHSGETYQPIPFSEYKDIDFQRKDCGERYRTIKENCEDPKGETLIDICCANGYFCFRFLQDGGKMAAGIEKDKDRNFFNNELAKEKEMNFISSGIVPIVSLKFDIGIYLDTHYAPDTEEYPIWLSKYAKIVFTSSAEKSEEYNKLLKGLFKNVEPIYKGFMGRIIYKCY